MEHQVLLMKLRSVVYMYDLLSFLFIPPFL